ncbi:MULTISPECIES: hypothetical protein [unclassified Microbacterium]|uniref:P-type ATPase n=1 Tax=unclassified Microbacterium TaxID=2609290 RepID=UPI003C2E8330
MSNAGRPGGNDGESVPIRRGPGDPVLSGTVNGTGARRVRVGRPASESVIARVVALVETASATKAKTQLFIEKVEQRYSVGVVVATLVVFFLPLALGEDFQARNRARQVRVAAGVIGEHVEDPEGGRAETDREPPDGGRLLLDESSPDAEEFLDLVFLAGQGLQPDNET